MRGVLQRVELRMLLGAVQVRLEEGETRVLGEEELRAGAGRDSGGVQGGGVWGAHPGGGDSEDPG